RDIPVLAVRRLRQRTHLRDRRRQLAASRPQDARGRVDHAAGAPAPVSPSHRGMLATAAPCWQLNSSPDRITLSYMEKGATLTVRLSSQSLQALRRRAPLAAVARSDLVRAS